MSLSPLTLFVLSFFVGALGGLWHVISRDDLDERRDYCEGVLGGSLVGLALSLLLYDRLGITEYGQCTLLGLSLILSMAGKEGFHRLLNAAAKLYLGDGGSYPTTPSSRPTIPGSSQKPTPQSSSGTTNGPQSKNPSDKPGSTPEASGGKVKWP